MSKKIARLYVVTLVLTFALVAAVPAFAGSSIVGSLAGSMNATIGGQPAPEGSVLFSGDSLKVKDGAAVVAFGRGGRAVFGRNSEVSFLRDGESVTARLASGSVSIFQPLEERNGMQVKFENVTIGPAGGYKTLGEVAMLGDTVVVRTKEGVMNVNFANGKTTAVPAGEVLRLSPKSQRAPQTAAGSQHFGAGANGVEWAALAAGTTAAILAGIALGDAGDAKNNANSATSAANAATSAATAAGSTAATAASAASAATAAALLAAAAANATGCALNSIENTAGEASPYTPPTGLSCSGLTINPLK
jgi:hypothetical protein